MQLVGVRVGVNQMNQLPFILNDGSNDVIQLQLIITGDVIDNITAGTIDVYIKIDQLP